MKLVVQIPCLNEADTLAATVADIPRRIDGVDAVELLVIDDGSTDGTPDVARAAGVDHLLSFPRNRGLGQAIRAGFDESLRLGADIVVNTDGDNQYYGGDIPALIRPILEGRADLVIGDRQTGSMSDWSPTKRRLQAFGSRVVSRLAGLDVPDVASGFRAYSAEALLALYTHAGFDHTVEHTIQAGHSRLSVVSVPVRTNPKARESRLFSSIWEFVGRSSVISLRTWATYKALPAFFLFGAVAVALGLVLGLRFLYFFAFTDEGELHIQSVVLAAIFLLAGFQMFLTGIVTDLIATNRMLASDALRRVRRLEIGDAARWRGASGPSGDPALGEGFRHADSPEPADQGAGRVAARASGGPSVRTPYRPG